MSETEHRTTVAAALKRYGGGVGFLIPILQDLQRQHGYLPVPLLQELSRQLHVPPSQTYHVATFYKSFSLKPRGRHLLSVCTGTVCHLKGAEKLVQAIRQQLKLPSGETTDDLRFSLENVNCVGACALAPVLVTDGTYHAKARPGGVAKILKACE